MNELKTIIFDVDGTLSETHSLTPDASDFDPQTFEGDQGIPEGLAPILRQLGITLTVR